MAKALVLQNFPYSSDGYHIRLLEAGTAVEIRDDLLPGLIESGQVSVGDLTLSPRVGAESDASKRRR